MSHRFSLLVAAVLAASFSGSLFAAEPAAPAEPATPAVSAPVAAPAPLLTLEEASVGTGVMDRAIQGAADSFSSASVEKVYCFTKVTTESTPASVRHVWTKEGAEPVVVELNVGGSPWRTWSSRNVSPGSWTVDIQDAAGTSLKTLSFTVTE